MALSMTLPRTVPSVASNDLLTGWHPTSAGSWGRGEWEHLCRSPNTRQSVLAGAFLVGCGSLALAAVTVFFTP